MFKTVQESFRITFVSMLFYFKCGHIYDYMENFHEKSIHFNRIPHADFTTVSGHSDSFTTESCLVWFLKAVFESDSVSCASYIDTY